MSNPVAASQGNPLFGGLSGYLRNTPGKPTSVPGAAPAFRGITNKPGQPVKTPAIRTSYNRDNKGTNVVVPYARVVPVEHLNDVGRVSPGDVVFAARTKLTPFGAAFNTQMRLVGVDWLNRNLGGRPEYDKRNTNGSDRHSHLWQVGYNVLLGTKEGDNDKTRLKGNAISDEWRSLILLQEWTCDGVVLSNDEPGAQNSSGERDGQLFNIAIQGVCPVNNGYVSFNGAGVERNHRSAGMDKHGYYDGGEPPEHRDFATAFGGPYYQSYPLQMFDRKLRPLSDVYVGLVCTRRRLAPYPDGKDPARRYRDQLLANAVTDTQRQRINEALFFYTFHFTYFSSNQAFGYEPEDPDNKYGTNPNLAEPAAKRSRRHYEQAGPKETYDPYLGPSPREWNGIVGAWRVGKVLDTAATKKDQYYGGPVDTADRITVNVDIEFKDWRQLRRDFGRGDIGKDVPGATEWGLVGDDGLPLNDAGPFKTGQFPQDHGFVLQWPTEYVHPGRVKRDARWLSPADAGAEMERLVPANMPLDPTTIDQALRGSEAGRKQVAAAQKGRSTFGVHGLGREGTSTYSRTGDELPLDNPFDQAGNPVGQPRGNEQQSQLNEVNHEFSLLRPNQVPFYTKSLVPFDPDRADVPAASKTNAVPDPSRFGLGGTAGEDVRGSAAASNGANSAAVRPAMPAVSAPSASGVAATVTAVTAAAARPAATAPDAASKGKAKAPIGASFVKKKTPPKQRPPPSTTPSPAPGSVAAAITAPVASVTSPGVSPAASPSVANTGASAAASQQQRPGVRRGRAGEQATADVFASIFGGDATPTASSAAPPNVQPSPSEGSDGGSSGQRGRVRRGRDGR